MVPQTDRRGRIILNLSAQIPLSRKTRAKPAIVHPSVNETTTPAEHQYGCKRLGTALPALLSFMFTTDPTWKILWHKIDLSDGFWRMVVEQGAEYNFVYQLPPKPGVETLYFALCSALQMGWMNSPAYFCGTTEVIRTLIMRILAFTIASGLVTPHQHEQACMPPHLGQAAGAPWLLPLMITVFCRVFVDDFINAIAHPPDMDPALLHNTILWLSRAAMHGIHAAFPPPSITGHINGRDSISEKKLRRGDATFSTIKELLGWMAYSEPGSERTVALPLAKSRKYIGGIRKALDDPRHCMPYTAYNDLVSTLQYVAGAMPCMRGFMTPLNRRLGQKDYPTVGLGLKSELRETLEEMAFLVHQAHLRPSHICELVPTDLPHFYTYNDASSFGAGGVILPCTKWIPPTVWRYQYPADITAQIQQHGNNTITNTDAEASALFIAECLLDHLLDGNVAGDNTLHCSDNSPCAANFQRRASRGKSRAPDRMLRCLGMRQRWTRRGPSDYMFTAGDTNTMADIPSRSFHEFPTTPAGDAAFLQAFSQHFPLPPQLGSWKLAHPSTEIISLTTSILRGRHDTVSLQGIATGNGGGTLPTLLAKTLSFPTCSNPPSTWNAANCSWPLLDPSGQATSQMFDLIQQRPSRKRYNGVDSTWSASDLLTLAATHRSKNT